DEGGVRSAEHTTVDASSYSGPGGSGSFSSRVEEHVEGEDQWRDTYMSGSGACQTLGNNPFHETLTWAQGNEILNKVPQPTSGSYTDLVSYKLLGANATGNLNTALPEPGRIPSKVEEAARNILNSIAYNASQLRDANQLSLISDAVRESARIQSDPLRTEVD